MLPFASDLYWGCSRRPCPKASQEVLPWEQMSHGSLVFFSDQFKGERGATVADRGQRSIHHHEGVRKGGWMSHARATDINNHRSLARVFTPTGYSQIAEDNGITAGALVGPSETLPVCNYAYTGVGHLLQGSDIVGREDQVGMPIVRVRS